jgi:Flagellar hook-length control protein FliK
MRPIGTAVADEGLREPGDRGEEKRERVFAELVLPEMLASCMANPYQAPREMSALAVESPVADFAVLSAASLGEAAETWRLRGGGLTACAESSTSTAGAAGPLGGVPAGEGKLITHIDAGELGKISLVVERTGEGMTISLRVDNPLTAAIAEMQRSSLEQSLRASGLGVVKVNIARHDEDGTELAQSPYAPRTERWRKRLNLTG